MYPAYCRAATAKAGRMDRCLRTCLYGDLAVFKGIVVAGPGKTELKGKTACKIVELFCEKRLYTA